MILITGGKYQGKLEYAKETFNVADNDVFDCTGYVPSDDEIIIKEKIVYNVGELIKKIDFDVFSSLHKDMLYDKIVIVDEVGCGIVPIDKADRENREKIGRAACMLARMADRVDRVVCGIGTRIK